MVPFQSIPRVYLSPTTPGAFAISILSVVLINNFTLSIVVPIGIPIGTYDLIVVNPGMPIVLLFFLLVP